MLNDLTSACRPAIVLTIGFFALTGLAYPAAVTGLAQVLFPATANGSLLRQDGHVIGSSLIGQGFARAEYFHPRPSAAGKGYDPTASGGSNFAPTAKALVERVKGDLKANPAAPIDLITASASGLDPHISPEAARYQAARISAARHMPLGDLQALIDAQTETPLAGIIGERRVNVLLLNLALDKAKPMGATPSK